MVRVKPSELLNYTIKSQIMDKMEGRVNLS